MCLGSSTNFSMYKPSFLNDAPASIFAALYAFSTSSSAQTTRIPLPPPPAVALIITGYPIFFANTLAASTLYGKDGPAIVVDFGTSTNLDVVSPKGEFLGGALAPGIEISVEALAARAAQLRKVELIKPKSVIGKNTVEALQSGTIFGFAGQVDGLVNRIIDELEELYPNSGDVSVIATGGLAPLVLGISESIEFHEPDLTLIGLRLVYERN